MNNWTHTIYLIVACCSFLSLPITLAAQGDDNGESPLVIDLVLRQGSDRALVLSNCNTDCRTSLSSRSIDCSYESDELFFIEATHLVSQSVVSIPTIVSFQGDTLWVSVVDFGGDAWTMARDSTSTEIEVILNLFYQGIAAGSVSFQSLGNTLSMSASAGFQLAKLSGCKVSWSDPWPSSFEDLFTDDSSPLIGSGDGGHISQEDYTENVSRAHTDFELGSATSWTSLINEEIEPIMDVYPNPVGTFTKVRFSSIPQAGMLTLLGVDGSIYKQIAIKKNADSLTYELFLNDLPSGIYILRLDTAQYSVSTRLLKQ
ncbi:MAG: T9SS type A sorting domain-containing protein [Bacteroidota bacterium]